MTDDELSGLLPMYVMLSLKTKQNKIKQKMNFFFYAKHTFGDNIRRIIPSRFQIGFIVSLALHLFREREREREYVFKVVDASVGFLENYCVIFLF